MTNTIGPYQVISTSATPASIGPFQVERSRKVMFGGKREPTLVLDRKTKKILPSKAAVGRLYYSEYNLPYNNFVYYQIIRVARDRHGLCRFLDVIQEDGSWVFQDPMTLVKVPMGDPRLEWEG